MKIGLFLARLPLFQGLSGEELDDLSGIARERDFAAGEGIFREGEAASGLHIVFSGRVKIFKVSPAGKEQILHVMGPGEPFGEVPVFQGGNYPAAAAALEPSRIVYIAREDLLKLIRRNPALALDMLAVLSRRLREFAATIENLSLRGVPERLSAYLLHLGDRHPGAAEFELDLRKGVLANLLGTTGESLSRVLGKLSGAGMIRVAGKRIAILDRKALAEVAEGRMLE